MEIFRRSCKPNRMGDYHCYNIYRWPSFNIDMNGGTMRKGPWPCATGQVWRAKVFPGRSNATNIMNCFSNHSSGQFLSKAPAAKVNRICELAHPKYKFLQTPNSCRTQPHIVSSMFFYVGNIKENHKQALTKLVAELESESFRVWDTTETREAMWPTILLLWSSFRWRQSRASSRMNSSYQICSPSCNRYQFKVWSSIGTLLKKQMNMKLVFLYSSHMR